MAAKPKRQLFVSDIHACFEEFVALLEHYGFRVEDGEVVAPDDVEIIFLGDMIDRGHSPVETMALMHKLLESGAARWAALGNHDIQLKNAITERKYPKRTGGLAATLRELTVHESGRPTAKTFIRDVNQARHASVLPNGIVCTHASIRPEDIPHLDNPDEELTRRLAYGESKGEVDDIGRPIRTFDWADEWKGRTVVFGHNTTPNGLPGKLEGTNVYCIDTGCLVGANLCALIFDAENGELLETALIPSLKARGQNAATIKTRGLETLPIDVTIDASKVDLAPWQEAAFNTVHSYSIPELSSMSQPVHLDGRGL
jgi:protein phosphatase